MIKTKVEKKRKVRKKEKKRKYMTLYQIYLVEMFVLTVTQTEDAVGKLVKPGSSLISLKTFPIPIHAKF